MKEATGELSMTVVTIIAIIAIAGLVTWLAPRVTTWVAKRWGQIEGNENTAVQGEDAFNGAAANGAAGNGGTANGGIVDGGY